MNRIPQIAYAEDALSTSWYLLYIVANSAIERDDWISLVRFCECIILRFCYVNSMFCLIIPKHKQLSLYSLSHLLCSAALFCVAQSEVRQTIYVYIMCIYMSIHIYVYI